jgi:hypothetical protein
LETGDGLYSIFIYALMGERNSVKGQKSPWHTCEILPLLSYSFFKVMAAKACCGHRVLASYLLSWRQYKQLLL